MHVIKLGKNTYRIYDTLYAMSYLYFVKNGMPILKRIDGPDSFYRLTKQMQKVFTDEAFKYMTDYLEDTAKAWEIQGQILGSLA